MITFQSKWPSRQRLPTTKCLITMYLVGWTNRRGILALCLFSMAHCILALCVNQSARIIRLRGLAESSACVESDECRLIWYSWAFEKSDNEILCLIFRCLVQLKPDHFGGRGVNDCDSFVILERCCQYLRNEKTIQVVNYAKSTLWQSITLLRLSKQFSLMSIKFFNILPYLVIPWDLSWYFIFHIRFQTN